MTRPFAAVAMALLALLVLPHATLAVECSIGVLAPLTGGRKPIGDAVVNGAKLAASEASTNGVTIKLSYYDSQCNAAQSVIGIRAAVAAKVNGIVGDVCSSASIAASAIANAAKVPMISPTSSSPLLTTLGGAYFNRVNPSDAIQGPFLADLALKNGSKIGIVFGVEAYGEGIFHEIFKYVIANNGSLTGAVGTGPTWTAGTLGGILAGNPNSIIIASNYLPEIYKVATELRSRGFKGQLYGSDSISSDGAALVGPVGAALRGAISLSFYGGSAAFQAKYKAAYNVASVPPSAASAYDAVKAFQAACASGGQIRTGAAIQAALVSPSFSVPGATGTIRFDANGDRVSSSLTTAFSVLVGAQGAWVLK